MFPEQLIAWIHRTIRLASSSSVLAPYRRHVMSQYVRKSESGVCGPVDALFKSTFHVDCEAPAVRKVRSNHERSFVNKISRHRRHKQAQFASSGSRGYPYAHASQNTSISQVVAKMHLPRDHKQALSLSCSHLMRWSWCIHSLFLRIAI